MLTWVGAVHHDPSWGEEASLEEVASQGGVGAFQNRLHLVVAQGGIREEERHAPSLAYRVAYLEAYLQVVQAGNREGRPFVEAGNVEEAQIEVA